MQQESPYIVYVDESGDHALDALDPTYPIFVLAFCLFSKTSYAHSVIPTLIDFKFKYFGHDQVVLHESDIRKAKPPFEFLFNRAVRDNFMQDLNAVVESSDFSIIAGVIRKSEPSVDSTDRNGNPYHVALQSCLDRLWEFLETHAHPVAETYIIFEARGAREDADLELEFRRVCDGRNRHNIRYPFRILFAKKQINSSGLQLADLVARPIGRKTLLPDQENRAFNILEKKFFTSPQGDYSGWGLTIHQ